METVWPAVLPADSESRRRKITAVRYGQLAVVLLLAFAVTTPLVADKHLPFWPQGLGLIVASLVYVICFLHGLSTTVQWMLWENAAGPQPLWPPAGERQALYFAVQFGLAGLVCLLAGREGGSLVTWVVLLPPVVLSVFRLRLPGVALVVGMSMGLLSAAGWWHGWPSLPIAALEFSCAVLFALLFPALAMTSEKARGEVERLAGELSAANRKLREYAVQTEELAITRERNRLAREIHDSLGHYLTVVNVQLEAARAVQTSNPARLADALNKAQTLAQQGLQDIRRSVATLRASPLDDQPLAQALRQIAVQSESGGLAVEMQVLGDTRPISPQARLTLYRAGQEGLTNVRKHARVAAARLVLDFRSPATVSLSIIDHGCGAPDSPAGENAFGLLGLRERAQMLGGRVRVQTAPGAGFTLEVEVPE